jgi:aspartate racemase
MKVLGLIGGISWVSTVDYYKLLNEGVNQHLGANNFIECLIYSLNFQKIRDHIDNNNDWAAITKMIVQASKHLENGGAEALVLCANTSHHIADDIAKEISIPIIHIAVETANEINRSQLKKVGLLGTKFTMQYDFFKNKLKAQGIEPIIPDSQDDIDFMHATILDELGRGIIKSSTKERYLAMIAQLEDRGAEGIIAGCTEIPLIIKMDDINVPYFDTTKIHANAAVKFALSL